MNAAALYSDNDSYCAEWLRNLIAAEHIAPGRVDARDVRDLAPEDLDGHAQCHFFAGIGGWSYALRLAGWPDDRPVWTGSCPCQPFSTAGKREGHADERHLWPAWARLIRQCRPSVVFGEQVASADGLAWLDVVCADLEDIGYAVAAVDLPAAGVGAPHIRQRLFFVGDASGARIRDQGRGADAAAARGGEGEGHQRQRVRDDPRYAGSVACTVAHGGSAGLEGCNGRALGLECAALERGGSAGALADATSTGQRIERRRGGAGAWHARAHADQHHEGRPTAGFWRDADWIGCRDGKARPVEPRTFPLAHGVPGRVGRLRAYGNAIVPQAAAAVIRAYMEVSTC